MTLIPAALLVLTLNPARAEARTVGMTGNGSAGIIAIGIPATGRTGDIRQEPVGRQEDPLRFARSLYQDGLYDLAVDQLRRQLEGGLPLQQAEEARWLLGQALEANRRPLEAATAYRDFTTHHGSAVRAPEAWMRAGRLFAEGGDFASAAASYGNFLDLFPANDNRPRASVGLIEALLARGRIDDALDRVAEANRDYPFHPLQPRFRLLEAEARSIVGQTDRALALADEAARAATTPDLEADAAALKGRLLIAADQAGEAVATVREALAADPPQERTAALRSVLGQALSALGRHGEALPELRAAVDGTRGRERSYTALWLARTQAAVGEPDSALAAYEIALPAMIGEEAARMALEAARTARDAGRAESALAWADRARTEAVEPATLAEAVAAAADILIRLERVPEAAERLRDLIRHLELPAGVRAQAAMDLGRLYEEELADPAAAAGYYRLSASTSGAGELWSEALWASARALAFQGEYASAIVELQPLAGTAGQWGERAAERIAYWRRYRLIDLETGLRVLQSAVLALASGGSGGEAEALLQIARANTGALKDFSTAVDAYDRYLARVPDGAPAARAHYEKGQALEALGVIAATEQGEEAAREPRTRAADAYREAVRVGGTSEASERAQLALIELDLADLQGEPVFYYQAMRDRYRAFLDVFTASDRLNDVLLKLGEANEGLGRHADPSYYEEAADVYRLLLEPGKPPAVQRRARMGRGRSLYRIGAWAEAAPLLEVSLTDLPDGAALDEILFMAGDARLRSGDGTAAVVHFRELAGRFPASPWTARSSESTGDLLLEQGRAREAVEAYRRFAASCEEGDTLRARFKLARALSAAQSWSEAAGEARAAAAGLTDPGERLDALALWCRAARRAGDEDGELAAGRAIWQAAPASATADSILLRLGEMLSDRGELGPAEEVWTRIAGTAETDSIRARAGAELVYLAYAGGRVATAAERRETFRETWRREREITRRYEPFFQTAEGMMLLRGEQWERAEEILRQVVEDAPESASVPDALYALAVATARQENYADARTFFQRLVDDHPEHPQADRARFQLAQLAYLEADYQTAMTLYRRVASSPDPALAADAQFNLIQTLERMRLYESAQQEALTFLERFPDSESLFDVKMQLGRLYREGGQFGRAAEYFRNLRAADSEQEARLRWQLAETLFAMGNYEEAVLEYMKVAILNEDQFLFAVTARLKAADSYAWLEQRATAIDLYQQIITRYGSDSDYGRLAREHMENVRAGRAPGALPPQPPPRLGH